MKKGFTLIELLAVIVILAIILAIAIPGISNIINNSTRGAFESDAKLLLDAINLKAASDSSFNPEMVNEGNAKSLLGIDDSNYQTLTVKVIDGKAYVTIVGKNKWINLTISGTRTRMMVNDTVTTLTRGANVPVLAAGMTPIKWNDTAWVDTTTSDPDWYNYNTTDKKWANARTNDCSTPGNIETCSMWVWIPRYIYRISTGWHTDTVGTIDIQFSKGVDDNWNKNSIGAINLDTSANASNNKWTNEPAFTFGDNELTGIWVAKFEASAAEGVANGYTSNSSCPIAGDNVITKTVKIVPNVQSWRCLNVGNMFTVSRNMETNSIYGWGTSGNGIDTHMIKNTEWGALVYISKSIYGINNEIWINPADNYTTGCAGDSVSSEPTIGCLRTYTTTNGQNASTTGNIYGVYDMAGGSWEHVAAYVNNGNSVLMTNGPSIINADIKYKNVYTKGATDDAASNYTLTINQKGDAVYETSSTDGVLSWYADYSLMPRIGSPWFGRSGSFSSSTYSGAFAFSRCSAATYSDDGFRPVLVISPGI